MVSSYLKSKRRHVQRLDFSNGLLFFLGALMFRVRLVIPEPVTALALHIVGLSLYSIGFILWLIQSILNPDNTHNKQAWYGTFSERSYFVANNILGLLGIAFEVASFFLPVFIIPSAICMALSNLAWFLGEHQRTENPPNEEENPDYNHAKQVKYRRYVFMAMIASIATAIVATTTFFFPPFALAGAALGLILGPALIVTFFTALFNKENPLKKQSSSHSYSKISEELDNSCVDDLAQQPTLDTSPCTGDEKSLRSLPFFPPAGHEKHEPECPQSSSLYSASPSPLPT